MSRKKQKTFKYDPATFKDPDQFNTYREAVLTEYQKNTDLSDYDMRSAIWSSFIKKKFGDKPGRRVKMKIDYHGVKTGTLGTIIRIVPNSSGSKIQHIVRFDGLGINDWWLDQEAAIVLDPLDEYVDISKIPTEEKRKRIVRKTAE